MIDPERSLGRLEEFSDWAKGELTEIKLELRSLSQFKWKIAGGAAVLSVLVSLLFQFGMIFARFK